MAKWIKDISEKAISFNENEIQITVHVIIEKKDDFYIAHCLEFDITADGYTLDDVQENIVTCIKNHVEFCIEMGNFDKILDPAPPEYWNKLLFSKPLKNFVFPEDNIPPIKKNPIKSIDTYEVACCA